MNLRRIKNKKKRGGILVEIHMPDKILYYSDYVPLKEKIKTLFKKKYFKIGRVEFSKDGHYFGFPNDFKEGLRIGIYAEPMGKGDK